MARSNKFGTFSGVFTPSILTILGVIMFLRLPMIVGEAGLLPAIGIIVIAHVISFSTGLSVSSIATDKKVQAGGTYYIISRSLGLPIGGTLGLALFVGLSFSVSLYLIGFAESFLGYWGWDVTIQNIRIAGSIILLTVTTITFISTSLAIRTQYFIMAAIFLSLVSIFFGKHEFAPAAPMWSNPSPKVSLMVLFGIFFPAVTGFEAGVSMSGDLKDPNKSIPGGTISAVLVGFVVYLFLVFFFSYTVESSVLANDPKVLTKIAWIPELVVAGIWGATLSSALGSILGAPRILQATATDRIAPRFFAKGYGLSNEPRHALLLTFLIAEAGILVGELDVIARIVSIFFITTYGFLNLSSAFEYWTSPDFRPEFKIPAWVSVIGSLACFIVMIQLDLLATFGATLILGLLFLGLKRKELTLESGDAWSGIWASLVNTGIKKLNREKIHSRNWRPNILMFSGSQNKRPYMVELGTAMTGKLGILTDINLIEQKDERLTSPRKTQLKSDAGRTYFLQEHYCRDVYSGIEEITRLYGFSGVEPNMLFMGWSRHPDNRDRFVEVMKSTVANNFNLVFLDYKDDKKYGKQKSIDLWWSGGGKNLSFALSMLRHFTTGGEWQGVNIRLLAIKNNDQPVELIHTALERVLERYRMHANVKIINNYVEKLDEEGIIARESGGADMVILDLSDKYFKNLQDSNKGLNALLDHLGSTLLIRSSGLFEDIDVGLQEPERQKTLKKETKGDLHLLPELKLSKYSEVAAEVSEAQILLESLTSGLYEKAIISNLESVLALLSESAGTLEWASKELGRIETTREKYRKEKLLKKIKNDLFFRFREEIKNYSSQKVPRQAELLNQQIAAFDETLNEIVKEKPSNLRIVYLPEDLQPLPTDPKGVRLIKWKKRVSHNLSGKPSTGSISYRKIAKYFLYENRQHWLAGRLEGFLKDSVHVHQAHKQWIRQLLETMEEADKNLEGGVFSLRALQDKLSTLGEGLALLEEEQRATAFKYEFTRKEELNKNIQYFNNYLERIHSIGSSERKHRSGKYYRRLARENRAFGDLFAEDISLVLNSLSLELHVHATHSRVFEAVNDYVDEFRDKVSRNYLMELTTYLETLNKIKSASKSGVDDLSLEIDKGFKFVEDFQVLHRDIVALIDQLPEVMIVSRDPDVLSSQDGPSAVETMEIPVRKIATYFLESRLLSPLEQELVEASRKLNNSIEQTGEVNSLLSFSLENLDAGATADGPASFNKVVDSGMKKITEQVDETRQMLNQLESTSRQLLAKAFEPLGIAMIRKSTSELSHYLRDYQGRRVISRFGNWGRDISGWAQKNLVKVLYSRSEGVLLAKRLQVGKQQYSISSRLLDINDMVSPSPEIVKQLPPYYVNLFSGKSNIGKEFWVERPVEMAQAEKALERYEEGRKGAILIVGERNSGKTLLSKNIAYLYRKEQHVYQVFPPSNGSLQEEDLAAAFRKASGAIGGMYQIMASEPAGRVWILNDLELWWERSEDGMGLISLIGDLIDRYSSKFVFIINLNPFALAFINRLIKFDSYFIETIHCRPFDAEELRDLILRRHETSGLKLTFRKGREEMLSEVRMATLFHDFFSYSGGNPGVALNAWLANIRQVYGEHLLISRPDVSGTSVLKELPADWYIIASALALHKRLDNLRLLKITEMDHAELEKLLLSMQRSAIIAERMPGLYILNPFIEPHILEILKEKELI